MVKITSKEAIESAARKLIIENEDIRTITTRAIASEADLNPALINYYYSSKELLIQKIIEEIVSESFDNEVVHPHIDNPRKDIFDYMCRVCERQSAYARYYGVMNSAFVSEEGIIKIANGLLPFLRAFFLGNRSDTECRETAFEMICTVQMVLVHRDEYKEYSGADLGMKDGLRLFISRQMDRYLGDGL